MKVKIIAIFIVLAIVFGPPLFFVPQAVQAGFDFDDAVRFAFNLYANILLSVLGGGGAGTGQTFPQNFGGRVIASLPCLCSQSIAFVTIPVSGPAGVYNAHVSSLKQNYALNPGNAVLGTATQGGVCSVFVVIWCVNINTNWQVTFPPGSGVGTSLVPGV
ncbi:hypothetical protein CL654_01005 [bacterium]|nr:hypothetical protein [bacterium]|tara:strand:+ start:4518 stop:4997 length:480 start_codon:yes stop_codon:yes gene_type:complete